LLFAAPLPIRQLPVELTLVAVVETLLALALLYLVNALVDVTALEVVLVEWRQFVDMLDPDEAWDNVEVDEDAVGRCALLPLSALPLWAAARRKLLGERSSALSLGSSWLHLSALGWGLVDNPLACVRPRLRLCCCCWKVFAIGVAGDCTPLAGAPRPLLPLDHADDDAAECGSESANDCTDADTPTWVCPGAAWGGCGLGAFSPIINDVTLLAVADMGWGGTTVKAISTGEWGEEGSSPEAIEAADSVAALVLPKLSFHFDGFFWATATVVAVGGWGPVFEYIDGMWGTGGTWPCGGRGVEVACGEEGAVAEEGAFAVVERRDGKLFIELEVFSERLLLVDAPDESVAVPEPDDPERRAVGTGNSDTGSYGCFLLEDMVLDTPVLTDSSDLMDRSEEALEALLISRARDCEATASVTRVWSFGMAGLVEVRFIGTEASGVGRLVVCNVNGVAGDIGGGEDAPAAAAAAALPFLAPRFRRLLVDVEREVIITPPVSSWSRYSSSTCTSASW
jgi:hypothetical protein